MSQRIQRTRTRTTQRAEDAPLTREHADISGVDALLDEIDELLESDAEEYVKSFVQKGGQ